MRFVHLATPPPSAQSGQKWLAPTSPLGGAGGRALGRPERKTIPGSAFGARCWRACRTRGPLPWRLAEGKRNSAAGDGTGRRETAEVSDDRAGFLIGEPEFGHRGPRWSGRPAAGGEEQDRLFVVVSRQSGYTRGNRRPRHGDRGSKGQQRALQPTGAVELPVRQSGRVTVSAHGHLLDQVTTEFDARCRGCLRIRRGSRAGREDGEQAGRAGREQTNSRHG